MSSCNVSRNDLDCSGDATAINRKSSKKALCTVLAMYYWYTIRKPIFHVMFN